MDTSENYVLECKRAEEIQNQRPSGVDEHDYFFCPVHGFGCDLDNAVWLPRQDQLQEMVQEDAITQIQRLWGWIITSHYTPIGLPQPSMEQLWLAFVMENNYGKAWDGQEWVKIPVEV